MAVLVGVLLGISFLFHAGPGASERGGVLPAQTPPAPAASWDPHARVTLAYDVTYAITNALGSEQATVALDLTIRGEQGLLSTGNITYAMARNLSSAVVVSALQAVLVPELVSYFRAHAPDETFTTYFDARREAVRPADVTTNASYTPFWLNSSAHPGGITPGTLVSFYRAAAPTRLVVERTTVDLAEGSWDAGEQALARDVRVLPALWIQSRLTIATHYALDVRLYYDARHAVLLYGEFAYVDYETTPVSNYSVTLALADTSLALPFYPANPYYDPPFPWAWLGVGLALGGAAVGALVVRLLRQRHRVRAAKQRQLREIFDPEADEA